MKKKLKKPTPVKTYSYNWMIGFLVALAVIATVRVIGQHQRGIYDVSPNAVIRQQVREVPPLAIPDYEPKLHGTRSLDGRLYVEIDRKNWNSLTDDIAISCVRGNCERMIVLRKN